MEPAGLAVGLVGLAGLFNTCLEVVHKYDSWKSFGPDLRSLTAQFETQKIRLERWGEAVGIGPEGLSSQHNGLLDNARILANVKDLLSSIKETCGLEDNTGTATASGKFDYKDTSRGLRRKRLNWALRNKEKWIAQVTQFSSIVDGLHNLVPVQATDVLTDQAPWVPELKQVLTQIEQEKQADIRRSIQGWLLDDHCESELYEVYVKRSVEGSCKWILDRPWFLKWLSVDFPSRSAKYLWINGPAGFGKSILCAKLIQHLLVNLDTPVAYFICDSETRDPFLAVRFWLSQLVSHEKAFGIVRGKWETTEAQRATRGEILSLLQEIVSAVPGCTLVLDGLDECEFAKGAWPGSADDSIPKFIGSLRQTTNGTSTRVLIMSRNEPEIRYGLLGSGPDYNVFEHQITPDDVRDDVIAYSRSIVNEKLPRKPDATKDGITKRLAKRCNGQFLWVRLQQETLRSGKSERKLQEAISSTPPGIEHFYERNWERIMNLPDEDKARAFSILHWTAFSVRPLTVAEISGALVVGDDCEELQLDDLPDIIDEEYINTEITELCGSLLEVRDSPGKGDPGFKTLHLTHFSVKEFMLRKISTRQKAMHLNRIPGQSAEAIESMLLARKCLSFVNSPEAWFGTSTVRAGDVLGAFRTYAAGSWYRKAMIRGMSDTELVDSINRFFQPGNPQWASWKAWFDQEYAEARGLNIQSGVETAGPLYYAVRLGLAETVNYLIHEVKCDVHSRGYNGETPLQAASREGNLKIVRVLFEHGADVSFADTRGSTPLSVASINGNPEVVKVLIQFGADVNVRDSQGWAPIHMACYSGHAEIVGLLVQLGADVNISDNRRWAPIHMTCYSGNTEVLKTLLHHGANVSIATDNGWTPINVATAVGHIDVVKTLLQHGADVSVPNTTGITPLATATSKNHVEMVKLLLEWGADPADASKTGEAALHFAARSGRVKSAEILLQSPRINVDALDPTNQTPLFAAAARGHLSMVDTLLLHGADPNHTDHYASTPLSAAVRKGHTDVVKRLVMVTEDPINHTDGFGRTLLQWASKVGEPEILEIICDWAREHGMDADDVDSSVEPTTLTLVNDGRTRGCDVCGRYIFDNKPYYRCDACIDFDICLECFEMGMQCLSSSHEWSRHLPKG